MKIKYFILTLPLLFSGCGEEASVEKNTGNSTVTINFNFDSYNVSDFAMNKESINELSLFIKNNKDKIANIVIEGRADERGTKEYNLALSGKRANAVKSILKNNGIDSNIIKIVAYGKSNPLCSKSNESCWKLNRSAKSKVNNK